SFLIGCALLCASGAFAADDSLVTQGLQSIINAQSQVGVLKSSTDANTVRAAIVLERELAFARADLTRALRAPVQPPVTRIQPPPPPPKAYCSAACKANFQGGVELQHVAGAEADFVEQAKEAARESVQNKFKCTWGT